MLATCELADKLVIRFEPRMDTARCAEIEAEVCDAVAAASVPVAFDLQGVEFVSSAFLRFCIFASRRAGDKGFQVVNVGPNIKRVFKIAGLDTMLQGQ